MSVTLFASRKAQWLARNIVACHPDNISLENIQWSDYADGWPDIVIADEKRIRRSKDIAFLACLESPADVFESYAAMCAIARICDGPLKIVLPYFPVGVSDRQDIPGRVATAKSLARLLGSIPQSHLGGVPRLITYDIHALGEQMYFDDRITPRLETAIPLFLNHLAENCSAEYLTNISFAFPDKGAWQRFGGHFPKDGCHVILDKVREGDRRIVTLKEGDPRGKDIILIDDLVMSGETLLESARLMRSMGAKSVGGYVTHGVFPLDSWRKFLSGEFLYFWMTDSCPITAQLPLRPPFKVISLAPAIADALVA